MFDVDGNEYIDLNMAVGFVRLVANIRDVERSMGDGVKRVTATEIQQRKKLRRVMAAESHVLV